MSYASANYSSSSSATKCAASTDSYPSVEADQERMQKILPSEYSTQVLRKIRQDHIPENLYTPVSFDVIENPGYPPLTYPPPLSPPMLPTQQLVVAENYTPSAAAVVAATVNPTPLDPELYVYLGSLLQEMKTLKYMVIALLSILVLVAFLWALLRQPLHH